MALFRTGDFGKSRLEAFSDGVFAIVITLLVLELKVPVLPDGIGLHAALLHLLPKFLSWIISFAIVLIYWVNHHRFFDTVKKADYGLLWLNGLQLMCISFIPFPTALLGEYPGDAFSVFFFGAVMSGSGLVFAAMRWHVVRTAGLLKEDQDRAVARRMARNTLVFGPTAYALAALSALLDTRIAFALYTLIPVYFILPRTAPAPSVS
jgi:uncharacterized membrane protein